MELEMKPNVKPYQYNAFVESIISSHVDHKDWYHNNYVQLYSWTQESDTGKEISFFEYLAGNIFGYVPLIQYENYSEKVSKNGDEILNILKRNDADNVAWYLLLDNFFLKESNFYKKKHFVHDVLIYQDNGNEFEYLEFVQGVYGKHKIDYDTLIRAYNIHDNKCTYKIKKNENGFYKFRLSKFIEMLKDYIYARDSRKKINIYLDDSLKDNEFFFAERLSRVNGFGIELFGILQNTLLKYTSAREVIDYRMIYLLYEHKVNMINHIQYCAEQGYLDRDVAMRAIQRYILIKDSLYVYVLVVIKYNYNYNFKIKSTDEICKRIDEIEKEEKSILIDIVSGLECN